jgi:hypothetical protein
MSLTIENGTILFGGEALVTSVQLSSESEQMTNELFLETSSRISGDTSLSIICSNILGTVTTSSLDTLAELASALSNDPSFVFNISSSLVLETSNRISGDASLSVGLSSEISSRISGDASLSAGLSSEISSRISGDASLSDGLSSEISSRISGDASLSAGLSSEISSRISGDASLSTGLSSETSSRISGDASLSSVISTILTATTFNGTATNATNTTITASSTNATFYPTFVSATTGNLPQLVDTTLTYNPSTDTLVCANITGTATTATNANNVLVTSDDTSGNYCIPFVKTGVTGNKALFMDDVSGPLYYNPDTQLLNLGGNNTAGNGGQLRVIGPAGETALRLVGGATGDTREFVVLPKTTGAYNPAVASNDIVAAGISSTGQGTSVLRLTTWSDTNSSIRVSGNAVLMGAGGTFATATTSITTDGSAGNIIMNTGSVTRLTIGATGLMTFQGGMTYDNATNTLTATNFAGNATSANNALVTNDNTSGTYYIPFVKTTGTGSKALFQDDTTGPLTYDPSSATLSATNFAGSTTVTNNTSTNAFLPVCLSPSGTTGQKNIQMVDSSSGYQLSYRPINGQFCVPYVDLGVIPIQDDFLNLNNGPFGFSYSSDGGSSYAIQTSALGNQISGFGNNRVGLLQINSGGDGSANQSYVNSANNVFTSTNYGHLAFGIVPLGLQTLSSITTVNNANQTYTHYAVGLSSGANTFNTTQNGIFWRNTTTDLSSNSWEFVVNNVVQLTASGANLTGPLTGKWLRFDFLTAAGGGSVRTKMTNFTDGVQFGPFDVVLGDATAQFNNIYMACGSQLDPTITPVPLANPKYMGVDYVVVNSLNTQVYLGGTVNRGLVGGFIR